MVAPFPPQAATSSGTAARSDTARTAVPLPSILIGVTVPFLVPARGPRAAAAASPRPGADGSAPAAGPVALPDRYLTGHVPTRQVPTRTLGGLAPESAGGWSAVRCHGRGLTTDDALPPESAVRGSASSRDVGTGSPHEPGTPRRSRHWR